MANKTVRLFSGDLAGETGLTLELINPDTGAVGNGAGDSLTEVANGLFETTVTEAITGWWKATVKKATVTYASGGNLYIASDVVGEYLVDDPALVYDAVANISLDESAIATSVFQLIIGSGVARYTLPTDNNNVEALRYVDFDLDITTVATAADSRFVLSVGCEGETTPYLEADSSTGLISLLKATTFEATWASVTRISSTLVRVFISANAMRNVPAADYLIELREIKADESVKLRYENPFSVRSGVGRIVG